MLSHLLRLEHLDIDPVEFSAQADERMTCAVTSARKINDAACGCTFQRSPSGTSAIIIAAGWGVGGWFGEKGGTAAVKPNQFFIPKCESSEEARWILLPRARINPAFKRLPLLKSPPVSTRLHCHNLPVPEQINTTQRIKEHAFKSAHMHTLTYAHSQVCTKWWNVSFLFCASQYMRSFSTEVSNMTQSFATLLALMFLIQTSVTY